VDGGGFGCYIVVVVRVIVSRFRCSIRGERPLRRGRRWWRSVGGGVCGARVFETGAGGGGGCYYRHASAVDGGSGAGYGGHGLFCSWLENHEKNIIVA